MKTHTTGQDARRKQGFTLVELMIVVAVVAILAAIAYPNYREYVLRSNRSVGQALLADAAARQERFFSDYNRYTQVVVEPPGCQGADCGLRFRSDLSEGGLYRLSVPAATNAAYRVTASAIGNQTQDTACMTMSRENTGARTAQDADGGDSTARCWR